MVVYQAHFAPGHTDPLEILKSRRALLTIGRARQRFKVPARIAG